MGPEILKTSSALRRSLESVTSDWFCVVDAGHSQTVSPGRVFEACIPYPFSLWPQLSVHTSPVAFLTSLLRGDPFLCVSSLVGSEFLTSLQDHNRSLVFQCFLLSLVSRWRCCPEGWVGIAIARRQRALRGLSRDQAVGTGSSKFPVSDWRWGRMRRNSESSFGKFQCQELLPRRTDSTPTKLRLLAHRKSTHICSRFDKPQATQSCHPSLVPEHLPYRRTLMRCGRLYFSFCRSVLSKALLLLPLPPEKPHLGFCMFLENKVIQATVPGAITEWKAVTVYTSHSRGFSWADCFPTLLC